MLVAGYHLQTSGLVAPNTPIRASVQIPTQAIPKAIEIDPNGNFVLFAEVPDPHETTSFREFEVAIVPPNVELPDDAVYSFFDLAVQMPAIFFFYEKVTSPLIKN